MQIRLWTVLTLVLLTAAAPAASATFSFSCSDDAPCPSECEEDSDAPCPTDCEVGAPCPAGLRDTMDCVMGRTQCSEDRVGQFVSVHRP